MDDLFFKLNDLSLVGEGKRMDNLLKYLAGYVDERDWNQFHTPGNLAKSIVLEANELLEHFQWDKNGDDDDQGIEDELADVMSYCLMMCNVLDKDPVAIIYKKMAKGAEKYPAEKVKGSARKYTEYE